ncbi:hypothetical protein HOF56_01610 [Candidatus Peribacteria bacterium]|mgnify:CR=1 FL=1|nr:hypothetical protein [Candidatus Peribacteria bacterium]MBT4021303.1 hypothetical protein [Candidatus Peribacteria bacterium]MBT4241236.1 hypothetical protein [Candidatus Peribacteria bacterium]MBT4474261.1 hypothetical protein [Candidatus Peribacteria bacterium]
MLRKKIVVAASLLIAAIVSDLLIGGEQMLVPLAHAAPSTGGTSPIGSGVQKAVAVILEIVVVINWFSLTMIQWLLSPEALFGPNSAIQEVLRNIWITSRNIVNGIFAFILLFAGMYMILRAGEEGMSKIKQGLPKFVLAVIFVNFSWFFPRVILDVSNVMTATIYQIPNLVNGYDRGAMECYADLGADNAIGGVGEDADESCKYVWNVDFFPCDGGSGPCIGPQPNGTPFRGRSFGKMLHIYYEDWNTVMQTGMIPGGGPTQISGADMIINGLATNFAKLPLYGVMETQQLAIGARTRVGASANILAHFKTLFLIILQLIFALAVALPLLAMMFVLVARIIVLWLCIGFMPFIFVGYAMGGPLGQLSFGGEEGPNIWKKFVTYAFLPALIAVPFAVGFTLISALYYYQGAIVNASNANLPPIVLNGINILGFYSFHQMLWLMMTIGIIWFGTFAMLEKDSLASSFTGAIKGIGQSGFKTAVNAAGYAPIMPMPGGEKGGLFDYKNMLSRAGQGNPMVAFGGGKGKDVESSATEPLNKGQVGKLSSDIGNRIGELRTVLTGTNSGNATDKKKEFAKKVSELSQSTDTKISVDEAMKVASNHEMVKHLINSSTKLTDADKSDMISQAKHFEGTSNIDVKNDIKFEIPPGSSENEAEKLAGHKASTYIGNGPITLDDVVEKLEDRRAGAAPLVVQGINKILKKIEDWETEGKTAEQIASELKTQYPSP